MRIIGILLASAAALAFFLTDMDYTDRAHASDIIRDAGYYPFSVDAGR